MPITHGWTTAETNDPDSDVSADNLNDHSGTEDHGHTGAGDGGGFSGGLLVEYSGTLSSANLLDLGTPKVLVAGVTGKVYWPISVQLILRAGATPYTPGGGQIYLGPYPCAIVTDDFLDGATDQAIVAASASYPPVTFASVDGADLTITVDGDSPTVGNGTLDIWVLYRVTTP